MTTQNQPLGFLRLNEQSDLNVTEQISQAGAWIYALKCQDDCWYVGKTRRANPNGRFWEHEQGFGSAWTTLHRPLEMLFCRLEMDSFDEEKETLRLMMQHGIDFVRGGTFVAVKLPAHQLTTLESMLRSQSNTCFTCGNQGHYAACCPQQERGRGRKRPKPSNQCPNQHALKKRRLSLTKTVKSVARGKTRKPTTRKTSNSNRTSKKATKSSVQSKRGIKPTLQPKNARTRTKKGAVSPRKRQVTVIAQRETRSMKKTRSKESACVEKCPTRSKRKGKKRTVASSNQKKRNTSLSTDLSTSNLDGAVMLVDTDHLPLSFFFPESGAH